MTRSSPCIRRKTREGGHCIDEMEVQHYSYFDLMWHHGWKRERKWWEGSGCRELALPTRKWRKWGEGRGYREQSLAEIEGGEGMPRAVVSCEKLVEMEG